MSSVMSEVIALTLFSPEIKRRIAFGGEERRSTGKQLNREQTIMNDNKLDNDGRDPSVDLIPFHQLAPRLPGRKPGQRLNPAAIYRWHKSGLKGPDGNRVRLQAQRLGGHWCTTMAWLRAFNAALEGEAAGDLVATKQRQLQEEEQAKAADRRLDQLGIRKPEKRGTKKRAG